MQTLTFAEFMQKKPQPPPPEKNDVLKKVSVIFAKEVRQYDPSLKSQQEFI